MARGGPRPNAGRKKNIPNKRTIALREVAEKALKLGKTPLDVMIDNMNFWREQSETIGEQLKNLIVDEMDPAARNDAIRTVKLFLAARENAQTCAVDAAPYVHPKFQSIQINKTTTHTEISMTLVPAAKGEDRSYRENGNIIPIKRTAGN